MKQGRRVLGVALGAAMVIGAFASIGTAQANEEGESDVTPSVIGGEVATENYPFIASMQWKEDDRHRCGSSLIDEEWILTAAHCVTEAGTGSAQFTVMDPSLFQLRIGSNDHTSGGTVAQIEEIKVHPDWVWAEDRADGNDIALLKLDEPVSGTTVPLESTETKPGTSVRAIGWGDIDDSGVTPDLLRQLDVEVWDPATTPRCVEDDAYGWEKGDYCADREGNYGSCYGDSGSPLLKKANGRWVQVGLTSRGTGSGCGEEVTSIYTGVNHFRNWITNTIN